MSSKFRSFAASIFTLSLSAAAQEPAKSALEKPVLSILSITDKLDARLFAEFEHKPGGARVRVDFLGPRLEIETRLRSTPRAWQLVFTDERHLRSLTLARLLRPASSPKLETTVKFPLEKRSRLNEDGRNYFSFMADPLGIMWSRSTLKSTPPASWVWLSDMSLNPLWRGRLAFPSDPHFQFLIALKAMQKQPSDLDEKGAPDGTIAWLKNLRQHSVSQDRQILTSILTKQAVAGVGWYSEYLASKKVLPDLDFGVPKEGTYFERYGFAFVADGGLDETVSEFMAFALENRDVLARAAQLIPLTQEKAWDGDVSKWSLIEDEVPFPKLVEADLRKLTELK